jgi:uncharacterized membrane protein
MMFMDVARGFGGRGGFGPDGFWFFFPGLLAMLLLAGLVGLVVYLVTRSRATSSSDPLRHAAARYASGKIGRVEFERLQRDLAAAESGTILEAAPDAEATTPQT